MTRTYSLMMPLGTVAPDFALINAADDRLINLNEINFRQGLVVMFICNHCPYVKNILDHLIETVRHYQKEGITFIAINANDTVNYPDDSFEKMKTLTHEKKLPFFYLFDEDQKIAKEYQAACTPDFFLFNQEKKCVYRGRYDNSTPGNNIPVSGKDLLMALDQLIKGEKIFEDQHPSLGCNIKWKSQS